MSAFACECSRRSFLSAVASICAAGAMVGCANNVAQPSSNSSDKDNGDEFVFTVALGADPTGLDPALATDYDALQVMAQVYEGLLRFEESSYEVVPCLAELPQISEDGLSYSFAIKDGITFHDGTKLTAQAIQESLQRQLEPNRSDRMVFSSLAFGSEATGDGIESVEATDKNTLVIKLRTASTSILSTLAMCALSPVVAPNAFDTASEHPVGTGPYSFVNWEKGKSIVLERFGAYWNKERAGKAKRITYDVVSDAQQRAVALQSKAADVALALDGASSALSQNGCEMVDVPAANVSYVAFNTASEVFKKEEARIAFAKAIDVPTLVASLYGEDAAYANSIVPVELAPYAAAVEQIPYDGEEAKAKLAELGITKVRCLAYSEPRLYNRSGGEALAQALQGYAQRAGVTLDIQTCGESDFKSRLEDGEYDICLAGWSVYDGEPVSFYKLLANSSPLVNVARFDDKDYKELVHKADAQTHEGERQDLCLECERYLAKRQVLLPLWHAHVACGHQSNVQGVVYHPAGIVYLHDATKR